METAFQTANSGNHWPFFLATQNFQPKQFTVQNLIFSKISFALDASTPVVGVVSLVIKEWCVYIDMNCLMAVMRPMQC